MPGAGEFTTRPELAGTFGMVASTHWLASAAGQAVLEKGGNAFDAAAAAGLVLQVVEPHLSGPGGEVPIIGFDARRGGTFVIDGQGPAPVAATPGAFAALDVPMIPGNGLLAACVPGAFGAWLLLLREHGTARLRDVMCYAIGYAVGGYPVGPTLSGAIAGVAEMFREHWPSSAQVYLPRGQVPAPGSRFSNPQLAVTYQRVLDEAEAAAPGRDEQIEAARRIFYEGFVAEALVGYLDFAEVMDATGRPNRGLLGYDDLAAWRPGTEAPLTFDYAGLTVCKTQPWGQGPVFLQQAIDAAEFHTRHFPSSFYPREAAPRTLDVEERVGERVITELRRRGHEVLVYPPWSLGRVSAVARHGGLLYAAANPRGMQGYATGR